MIEYGKDGNVLPRPKLGHLCKPRSPCHEWRAIASRFLYDIVQIPYPDERGKDKIEVLIATLRDSMQRDAVPSLADLGAGLVRSNSEGTAVGPGLGYGRWVRRIDCFQQMPDEDNFPYLVSLLELCDNVSILGIEEGLASKS